MSDDLIHQLAEIIARKVFADAIGSEDYWAVAGDTISDGYWDELIEQAKPSARAVLASGLVIPTSAVLNRAKQWDRMGPALTDGISVGAELRALTRQETP